LGTVFSGRARSAGRTSCFSSRARYRWTGNFRDRPPLSPPLTATTAAGGTSSARRWLLGTVFRRARAQRDIGGQLTLLAGRQFLCRRGVTGRVDDDGVFPRSEVGESMGPGLTGGRGPGHFSACVDDGDRCRGDRVARRLVEH